MMGLMDKLDTIPSQWRWMMIPILIAALGSVYWYVSYKPRAEAIAELNLRIDQKQSTLNKYRQIAKTYNTFKAQVEGLEVELHKALVKLPSGKEIPDLIRQISDLGVRTGLQITLLRPKAESVQEFYAEVPITVQVVGQYHSVGDFFDRVGRLPRIVSVSGIQMDLKSFNKTDVLETQCLATTYRFLEPDELDAATAQGPQKKKPRKH